MSPSTTPAAALRVRALLALLLAALAAPAARAGSADKGTSGAPFLKLGAGARATGLGDAYSALADDASALYWNPAALTRLSGPSATLMHAALFGGASYDFAGYGQPLEGGRWWGAALQHLSLPKLVETDASGFPTGASYQPRDLALSLAFAGRLTGLSDELAWGASGKLIRSQIVHSASALALDFGLLSPAFELRDGVLRIGGVVQNLGTKLNYGGASDPLPLNLKAAAAYTLEDWSAAADLSVPRDNKPYLALGLERRLDAGPGLALAGRLGLNTLTWGDVGGLSGFSLGLGARASFASLDYAFLPFGSLGATHRLSLGLAFGAGEEAAKPARAAPKPAEAPVKAAVPAAPKRAASPALPDSAFPDELPGPDPATAPPPAQVRDYASLLSAGQKALKVKLWAPALAACRDAAAHEPDAPEPRLCAARALNGLKRSEEAYSAFDQSTRVLGRDDPRQVEALGSMAAIKLKKKDLKEAKRLYWEAIVFSKKHKLDAPVVADLYLGFAYCFELEGKKAEAIKVYKLALERLAPGDPRRKLAEGRLENLRGD